jgi:hypothetical protein
VAPRDLLARTLLPGFAAASIGVLPACNNDIKLDHFLQGTGPSFVATHTFGQLLTVSPSPLAAHYLAVRLAPPDTAVLIPSSGEVFFDDNLDGLANCLVLKPKLRDEDDATALDNLGPRLSKPDKLRLALCNLDHTGGAPGSPLGLAVQAMYTTAGADDPSTETAEFFDTTLELDERKVDVWAAPEAVFPGPPGDGQKSWTSLGPADADLLHVGLFSEDSDGNTIYLNPVPYLAKILPSPPASSLRPPTFAEIRLESADNEDFTADLRSYTFDLGTGAMAPDEDLDGFMRVFFRLTNDVDDGGSTPLVVPHEISYELRELPAGTERSRGRFFFNAVSADSGLLLPDLLSVIARSVYRTPGDGAPESDPANQQLWMRLPVDPSPVNPGDPVPAHDIGAREFESAFNLEAMDGGARRFPGGDYELDLVLASGFGDAASDTQTVAFTVRAPLPPTVLGVLNPVDSDGDGNIDDDANTGNMLTGNEFTYTSAMPGVLRVPVRVTITPDTPQVRSALAGRVRVRVDAIDDSHTGGANVQLAWDNPFAGEATAGSAAYDPADARWEAEATFTTLPPDNADFGRKVVTIDVLDPANNTIHHQTVDIEVFWPLLLVSGGARNDANFAKNHPGPDLAATATDTGAGRGASTRAPNWVHYWRQAMGATADAVLYDSTDPANFGETPAIFSFGRGAPEGPYTGPHRVILIEEQAQDTDTLGGTTTGIDAFADTVLHENHHAIDQSVGYTNTAFALGITGADPVADPHWSFNIAKPGVVPAPPLPAGRVYNHFINLNADGDFTDPGEDLDTDGDNVINPADGPGRTVESVAGGAESNAEHALAALDWGNPGKQHGTPNVHTD